MLPNSVSEVTRLYLVDPQDPVLNRVSDAVSDDKIRSPVFQALVSRMLDIAAGLAAENPRIKFVGLAAPQIGVSTRLIIVDAAYNGVDRNVPPDLKVFVNPRIASASAETTRRREGCYSTGRINGLVTRPERLTLEALNREGDPVSLKLAGMTARVVQHEIDHLDGIRFPDRITCDDHLHWVDNSGDGPRYSEHAENWTCLCPRERWLAMKTGAEQSDDPPRPSRRYTPTG